MSDLYRLGRKLTELGTEGLGDDALGLAPGEFLVLRDLYWNGTSSISDCVARTHLAQSRVSTVVQRLKDRGWVQTHPDPSDHRRTLVDVTELIKLEGERRRQHSKTTLDLALVDCSPDEQAALVSALDRLHELLVGGAEPQAPTS